MLKMKNIFKIRVNLITGEKPYLYLFILIIELYCYINTNKECNGNSKSTVIAARCSR
jgi:hypothetical protein